MDLHSWINTVIAGLALFVTGFIVPTLKAIAKIRDNDLAHIDAKLDRIEQKLDHHIEWHAEK